MQTTGFILLLAAGVIVFFGGDPTPGAATAEPAGILAR